MKLQNNDVVFMVRAGYPDIACKVAIDDDRVYFRAIEESRKGQESMFRKDLISELIHLGNIVPFSHTHKKTGNQYHVLNECSIKMPDCSWQPGVIYTNGVDKFVRLISDFEEKFVEREKH